MGRDEPGEDTRKGISMKLSQAAEGVRMPELDAYTISTQHAMCNNLIPFQGTRPTGLEISQSDQ